MKIATQIMQYSPNNFGHILVEVDKLGGTIFDVEITTDGANVATVSSDTFYPNASGVNGRVIDPTGNIGERSLRFTNDPKYSRADVFYITILNPLPNATIYVVYSYIK
jgi:hypothetical protein